MYFLFTALAYAETAAKPEEPSIMASIFPLIVIFAVFYFLLIRPEQKKRKEHMDMVAELKVGDSIVTKGGIIGVIEKTEEETITIKVAGVTKLKLERNAVSALKKSVAEPKKETEPKKEADKEKE